MTTAPARIDQPANDVAAQDQIQTNLTHLSALLQDWQALAPGKTLSQAKTPEQVKHSLSTLRQLSRPGEAIEVLAIVQRLLALYPSKGGRPDSVAEDWVRVLMEHPLASIWASYEKHIRKPGQWAPSLGDFLQSVQLHARTVNSVRASLQKEGPGA